MLLLCDSRDVGDQINHIIDFQPEIYKMTWSFYTVGNKTKARWLISGSIAPDDELSQSWNHRSATVHHADKRLMFFFIYSGCCLFFHTSRFLTTVLRGRQGLCTDLTVVTWHLFPFVHVSQTVRCRRRCQMTHFLHRPLSWRHEISLWLLKLCVKALNTSSINQPGVLGNSWTNSQPARR